MSSEMSIPIGSEVYTLDGNKLGKVKEIRDEYFKVDSSMKPDYWLSLECVRGGYGTANRVTVALDKSRLSDYKVDLD